ncbi:MAG: endo-1,4-beta-xylanase, partial [Chloroflexi bacterium]|nr:endo-1,4-beta-xylanase [Chloroflexota bacterium]
MNKKQNIVHLLALVLFLMPALILIPACQGGGGSDPGTTIANTVNSVREWFIMSGAKDRIENMRKGDATISVVDAVGTPVRGARVYFEQESHEFLFGSNLTPLAKKGPNEVDQDWADAYISLFNYGTLSFNLDSYEPQNGQTREALLTLMADWAKKRGIVTKGSPLISANYVPPWAPMPAEDMQKALEKRVKDITGKFCGLVDYWDVVDEPTTGPRVNNMVGNWMNTRTPQNVIVDVLDWARSGCARATLIINDFRTDADFRDLLQNVIRQRGKFDAIGIQSHMHRGNWPFYQVWDICERFKDFDVPIHFTEVTVLSGDPKIGIGDSAQPSSWPTMQEGEIAQAAYVEKFYTLLFSHPSVQAITWWDFSDLGAWQGAP